MLNFGQASALQDFSEHLICEGVIVDFQKKILSFVYEWFFSSWCFSNCWTVETFSYRASLGTRVVQNLFWEMPI